MLIRFLQLFTPYVTEYAAEANMFEDISVGIASVVICICLPILVIQNRKKRV